MCIILIDLTRPIFIPNCNSTYNCIRTQLSIDSYLISLTKRMDTKIEMIVKFLFLHNTFNVFVFHERNVLFQTQVTLFIYKININGSEENKGRFDARILTIS